VRRRAAGHVLEAPAREAHVLRRHVVAPQRLPVDLDDSRCPRRAHLVKTVGAGHYQRPLRPQPRQGAGDRVQERRVRDADDLAGRAGGVRQRAEEVEDRAHGELLADRHDVAGGAVVRGREHEAEAGLADAARHRGGVEVDADAERLEHVGRPGEPGGRAVAVLGDRAPRARGDQGRGRGHVERLPSAAGAGGVHERVDAGLDRTREAPHRGGQADDLLDGLPLRAQGDEHGRRLDLRRVAGHDLRQHLGGLLGAEVAAGRERVDGAGQDGIGHVSRAGSWPGAPCRGA
jgi:hypothetical protein